MSRRLLRNTRVETRDLQFRSPWSLSDTHNSLKTLLIEPGSYLPQPYLRE